MITAKEACAKVYELKERDAQAIDAKCDNFIENAVSVQIIKAIEDRQFCCGMDIPKELKPYTEIIKKKLEELGYGVAVTHGYTNCISIGWNNCK
jgi:hypothetical protein